jgi:hypothetical protein
MRSAFILGRLPGMFLDDLIANGAEILRPGHRNTASQVEQGVAQRLQDDFVPPAYKSHPIAFLEIQGTANLSWNSHLTSTTYSTNDHHAYLRLSVLLTYV